MMAPILLIDTDVMIDFLRSRPQAIHFIQQNITNLHCSTLSVAELYQGLRDSAELRQVEIFLLPFTLFPVTDEIARLGGTLRNKYVKSHGMGLNDALIAATAQVHQATVVTLNRNHFPMLTPLIPYTK